ncbi:MAG: hypothetical protein HDR44_01000 [Allobaculum sp.]|nr:hypothetical protein [Allobaculum sp.]
MLIEKIAPWLDSALDWLNSSVLGSFDIPDSLRPLAEKIVVFKAFADAIPSLDLTLSPAGFAVINTEGRAPASKERVERLVASLRSSVDANLPPLVAALLRLPEFRESPMGEYWTGVLLRLEDVQLLDAKGADLLDFYRLLRKKAEWFQSEAEQNYLGRSVLAALRQAFFSPDSPGLPRRAATTMGYALYKFLQSPRGYDSNACPDPHEVWHLMQPVLLEVRSVPALAELWHAEMDETFNVEPFRNTRHGGYFF